MIRDRQTSEWASAVTDGWVDLAELGCVDFSDRPACGARGCLNGARWVDPSGVGWCAVHADQGLHGRPPRRTP